MRTQRQQPTTRVLLALAVALGSLCVGGLAARPADTPDGLTAIHTQPGFEPAVLRDRAPMLRPLANRSDPSGRLLPVLFGLLVAALGAAAAVRALGAPWRRARVRSLPGRSRVDARAPPPLLQPI
jgi:hypothetical protein